MSTLQLVGYSFSFMCVAVGLAALNATAQEVYFFFKAVR